MSHTEAAALVSSGRKPGVLVGMMAMLAAISGAVGFGRRREEKVVEPVPPPSPAFSLSNRRKVKPAKKKKETVYRHLQGYKRITLKGPGARKRIGAAGLATGYRSRAHRCWSVK